ncbi:MAG TPA: hypothetical protein DGT21_19530 [Armatimonadetes bacterium]|jgi:HEAT repeat protein|nr:hypothetical protein [Armatimonadota bacterium]
MRRYPVLIAIILAVCVYLLSAGCSLLPLVDPHGHDHAAEADEQEQEQQAEAQKPSEDESDMDLFMLPPEARERVKAMKVDELVELLQRDQVDSVADAATAAPYVYKRATAEDQKRIEDAVAALASSGSTGETRSRAVALLPRLNNTHSAVRAKAARSDADHAVRLAAILSLERDGQAVAPLLQELVKDPDSEIRKTAQDILSKVLSAGDDSGMRALVQSLGVYENDASALATTHLVPTGAPALPALTEAALGDPSDYRRAAATICIAMICAGDNEMLDEFAKKSKATRHGTREPWPANLDGLPTLIRVLETDSFGPAREAAAQGLGYLGSAKAAAPLAKALRDPDAHVRRRAAAAFETLPGESAVKELAHVAVSDTNSDVRRFAVKALGHVGTPEAAGALARATTDQEPRVRQAAADELGRLAAPEGFDALAAMLKDPVDDVRWAAARAIGELRLKEAVPHLLSALRDSYPPVSNAAERGLQKLGIAQRKGTGFREPEPEADDEYEMEDHSGHNHGPGGHSH